MENLEGYDIPEKTSRAIDRAHESGKTVVYIVLSCPDYLSKDGKYIFGELREGVPLLTSLHTEALRQVLESEDQFDVLVADVESHNRFLVDIYTNGDSDEYQRRCDSSIVAVGEYLGRQIPGIATHASSFLTYFEDEDLPTTNGVFIDTREAFYEKLLRKFGSDRRFENQVLNKVRTKQGSGYYRKEYGGRIDIEEQILQELTTMAEYLALGYLVAKKGHDEGFQPVIVSHATENAFMFNKVGVNSGFRPKEIGNTIDYPRTPVILRTDPII